MRNLNTIPIGEKIVALMSGPVPIRSGTSGDCEKTKQSFQKPTNNIQKKFIVAASTKAHIGMPNPNKKLDVVGDIQSSSTIWATSFTYTSDKKLKKNISQLDHALEKILALRGVSFDWKESEKHDVGFIAQEVQKQIPEIIKHDTGRDVLTVDYAKVVPFLVEAIKKQQKEIDALKHEINKLQR